jgi:exopolyphosphatase/guanosine-5'-triphosphate,3'-diphosphate pyrophosphatase
MSALILAVIDIGSNSIKLLVAAPGSPGGPGVRALFQETLETRISAGLGKNKSQLSEDGMKAGVGAVAKLLALAKPYAPTHLRLVATSAVRDAQNRADFAARILAATGAPLEILSGEDEALLIAQGIQTDAALRRVREFCITDLGGGSLECIRFRAGKIEQALSFPLGAVRLTEKFAPNPRGPFGDSARQAVAEETRRLLTDGGFHFLPGGLVVGTGGAYTVARAILAYRKGFKTKETWPAEMSRADLAALRDEIAPLDAAARARIPNLTPERADIMPAALTTILTLMDFAHVGSVVHSFHNLRFGVAARFFAELRGER